MKMPICGFILALAVLTGCGSGNKTAGSFSSPSAQSIQSVDLAQIKLSVTNGQTALQNAQAALGNIFNSNGTFNWDIFFGGVNFSTLGANTKTCLAAAFPKGNVAALVLTAPSDIAAALKCILDDVATTAGIANIDLTTALTTLDAALALVPAGSAEAVTIQSMITEVQSLQTSYSATMKGLAGQMNLVVTFLDQLPTLATGAVPIPIVSILVGMTVSDFVQPIVLEVMHFQSQLQAL